MHHNWSYIVLEKMERFKAIMYEAERYIWEHPQTGFKEWDAHNYLKEKFVNMGFAVKEAGNIPGFSFDIDTGKEGPTIAIIGELDALIVPGETDSGIKTCVMHACGHNCQVSALLGIAGVMADDEILSKLCGKIRIVAVPAEELTELGERVQMRQEGKIKYLSGKTEFMSRGFFDGVDIAVMVHTDNGEKAGLTIRAGTSGIIAKRVIYYGSKCTAGAAPANAVNALYAAQTAMNAINALRETFPEKQFVRSHSIITKGGETVQHIPSEVIVESNVRAFDYNVLKNINEKINRAYVAGAVAFGAQVKIEDLEMYIPENDIDSPELVNVAYEVGCDLFGKENVRLNLQKRGGGGTDMGNIGSVMPCIQPLSTGAGGAAHSHTYQIKHPEYAVFHPAVLQAAMACVLLEENGGKAKKIIKEYKPLFSSIDEYLTEMDEIYRAKNHIEYTNQKSALLNW